MSELSKLRDRWVRYERQIAKLEADSEQAMDDEIPAITEKIVAIKERLAATIAACHVEDLRLLQPDTKLIFKLKPREKKAAETKKRRQNA